MIFIIFIIYVAYSSDKTGLRIDLNVQVPMLENQYVTFQSSYSQSGVSQEIKPQYKILANLRNNSLGRYSEMFDFMKIDDPSELQCYKQNVLVLQDVQSCTYYCNLSQKQQILGARSIAQNITNGSIYVVDNTQLPCVNGTYFKLLEPWITVQLLFVFEDASYLIGTISMFSFYLVIILLVTIITIQIMSVIVLYYKLRKYKKKIKRSQEKKLNMGMRNDYQELMEGSMSMQEIRSSKDYVIQNE